MWQPLCSLAKALAGPQNLIKKRLDKLLDFERVEEKLLEAGSVTYEEQEARHTYQALNSLLVAELPQLNQLAMHWQAFPQFVSGASPFPFLGETGDRGR